MSRYKTRISQPRKGQLCICKCPEWCPTGFQIAEFDGNKFQCIDHPNPDFDLLVIEWLPLDKNGIPN